MVGIELTKDSLFMKSEKQVIESMAATLESISKIFGNDVAQNVEVITIKNISTKEGQQCPDDKE